MSDVRALLKAKRQEARIQHPYASYTSTGQLRCTACGTAIKQVSAWAGHVGSKGHRENVARQRTLHVTDQGEATRSTGKRKVEEGDTSEDEELRPTPEPKKRKVTPDDLPKQTPEHSSALPSDFFSDPSRALISSVDDDSSDEDEEKPIQIPRETTNNPIDLEWQRFQQEMLNSSNLTPHDQRHEAFQRATVFAEPELLEDDMVGLPTREAPHPGVVVAEVPRNEESRKRKEEEKELIIDRLLEEERAQEEADAKVVLLKGRLDALKKRRDEAKAARAKKPQ